MRELTVGDHDYRIGKLDARKQFHLARRLAPVFGRIAANAKASGISETITEKKEDDSVKETLAAASKFFDLIVGPVADSLAKMTDEEADYILFTCMGVVDRKEGSDSWAKVKATGQDKLMYQDIELQDLVQLTVATIQENLGSFFFVTGQK